MTQFQNHLEVCQVWQKQDIYQETGFPAMIRPIIAAFIFIAAFGANLASAQQQASYKNFSTFRDIVPGVDFFASNRQVVAPYEKPTAEAMDRLKGLLGANLPKGAIFICSTLEQKDSIYAPKVLKAGYGWILTAETPNVRAQQMLERVKSSMGGKVPGEFLERMNKMQPEMMATAEKQMVATITQQMAYAILQTTLDPNLQFRSSRLDDMGKSPLPDWLDIGIAAYASGVNATLSYLQQNLEQTFPLEDMLSMARPFVATSSAQEGGGPGGGGMPSMGGNGSGGQRGGMPNFGGGSGGMPSMGGNGSGGQRGGMPNFNGGGGGMPNFGGGGQGGPGGQGGMRGGSQRTMPKDEQDRMLFDGQSSTFFAYLMEKVGIDKVRELLKRAREGKESREYICQPDVLGSEFGKIEADWVAWVKAQKAPEQLRRN
jgi:hypothetical protein